MPLCLPYSDSFGPLFYLTCVMLMFMCCTMWTRNMLLWKAAYRRSLFGCTGIFQSVPWCFHSVSKTYGWKYRANGLVQFLLRQGKENSSSMLSLFTHMLQVLWSTSQIAITTFISSPIISAQVLWAALIYSSPHRVFHSNNQIAFPIWLLIPSDRLIHLDRLFAWLT